MELKTMKRTTAIHCLSALFACAALQGQAAGEKGNEVRTDPDADEVHDGFVDPPAAARPGAYWCWLNGNVSAAQITRDLEEMKAKGMGGAEIWDVQAMRNPGNFIPAGPAFMSDESVGLIAHAIREAMRLGLRLGLVASSGWNAGGAWVPPHFAGKGLFWSQTTVEGPAKVDQVLPFPGCPRAPKGPDGLPVFRKDIAVLAVPAGKTLASIDTVIDLTDRMDASGRLAWDAPAGAWCLLRFVCSNHGQHLIVPSPNSSGPMIDFIDPAATEFHLRYLVDKILAKLERKDFRGTAFKFMEFDSMELAHGVLWSDRFAEDFQRWRGYSPVRYLPLLAGWTLANDDMDQRFHYDFKLAVSDQLIFSHYVTGSRLLHDYGLELVAEAGGPGPPVWNTCPVDAIKATGAVDVPRGEFWIAPPNIWLVKEIASASHVYGKTLVDAESFTTWQRWSHGPRDFKRLADRAFCDGLNHLTFHTFAMTPPEAGIPGRAYHAGSDINPAAPWWSMAKPWMDYLSRCSHLLRQGLFVGDVCYFYGEQAPNFHPPQQKTETRRTAPAPLGLGYDYDVCDAQSILTRMRVEDGRLVLPDGMSYAILALPDQDFMSLPVLEKIADLVAAGATAVGPKPMRSVGLRNAAGHDDAVRRLADTLWGACDGKTVTSNRHGKGLIVWGPTWRAVLEGKGIGPDFHVVDDAERDNLDYIHRRAGARDFYFVQNKTMDWKTLDCIFRVVNGKPEYWNPVSGRIESCGAFAETDGGTRVTLTLPPAGSVFVVFGPPTAGAHESLIDVDKTGAAPALEIEGPWKLVFPGTFGAPDSVQFDGLKSWTESDLPMIKYFSGIVTYEKTFEIPAGTLAGAGRLALDLGDVKEVASVRVNGRDVGTVWTPPYRVDVTGALKPGANTLRVEVANLLANRIIGDRAHPGAGTFTKSNMDAFKADSPLSPAGLLGPVRLLTARP
jgi:hypothetical protein